MNHITELFCVLNNFCKEFNQSLDKALILDKKSKSQKSALSLSEAMTLSFYFINLALDSLNIFTAKWLFRFWKAALPKLFTDVTH